MAMKITQKHFIKGTREFEIVDDVINVRIRAPFNKEKITVPLTTIDPDPVVNGSYMEFRDRRGEPLLSLFLNNPGPEEFNAFVDTLKRRVLEEHSASAAGGAIPHPEPHEADESHHIRVRANAESVNVASIENTIQMLETYLAGEEVKPLLSALKALKAEPHDESKLEQVVKAFDDLGSMQGAVLTYAPYLSILFSDDPFGRE